MGSKRLNEIEAPEGIEVPRWVRRRSRRIEERVQRPRGWGTVLTEP
jgi:hypothetical protein